MCLLAAAISVLSLAPAHAEKRFIGAFIVTGGSTGCEDDPTNSRYFARFRPSGIDGNDETSEFAIFRLDYAQSFEVPGRFTAKGKAATWVTINDGGYVETTRPLVKFLKQTPAVLNASTVNVDIEGSIGDFDFDPGCTVTFRMTLTERD